MVPRVRVHGEPAKLPAAIPVNVNSMVPVGVDTIPALVAGSTTVALQTEPWLTRTVEGAHRTVVAVGRRLTVIVAAVILELEACAVSAVAGVYEALTLAEPEDVPVNAAVQVAVPTGLVP